MWGFSRLTILSRAWQRNDLLSVDITSLRHWKCVPKVRMGTSPSVFCLFFTCSLSKAHAGKIWNHAGCCFEFLLMQEHCRHVRCDRKVGHLTFPLAVNSFPRFMIFGSYMVLLVIFTGPYHIVLFHPISLVSHRFPKWFMSSFSPSGQNPISFRSILRHRPRSACHSLIRRDDLWLWSSRTSSTFQARARRARRAGYFFLARF